MPATSMPSKKKPIIDTAVILAGGKGTRLRPYTTLIPKPLVPIGDKPILEILIRQLKKQGITNIIICVNHLASLIQAFFGDGKKYGVRISYSFEKKPLHTIAPLKLIKNLPETFLVMNGDLLTDLDFRKLAAYHQSRKTLLTVATYDYDVAISLGVIDTDAQKKTAIGFREKPTEQVTISMGVSCLQRDVLAYVPKNTRFGFDDLMWALLEKNKEIALYNHQGYWLDIGKPEEYEKANNDMLWK